MNDLAAQRHEEEREEWLRLEKRDLLLNVLEYLDSMKDNVIGINLCINFITFMFKLRYEDILKE